MSVLVICPSRGRPERAAAMYASFRETASKPSTRLVIAIDHDDPRRDEYRAIEVPFAERRYGWDPDAPTIVSLGPEETGDLTRATNGAWARFATQATIVGTVNDDMLFRTAGWDEVVEEALQEPGIAYGNDLFQGERLVTSPFISSEIPLHLGWYALPACEHLFIDNAWGDIGRGIGRLTYLPDVVIEHLHPLAGKADWDEGYERANSQATVDRDRVAYETWRDGDGLREAIVRLAFALDHTRPAVPA